MPDAADAALRDYLAGGISAPVALMRLVLGGAAAEEVVARIAAAAAGDARLAPLLALARERRTGLRTLERMVRAGGAVHAAQPDPAAAVAQARAMFDRLVRISPEASVAAYSLGDPALLEAATEELRDWLRAQGLLARRPAVLDLGCGIGRLSAALAGEAGPVLGLDVSPAMVEAARGRCAGLPRPPRFETCSGRDLSGLAAGGFDLVLAVDVFPYLVQGGIDLAAAMMAEARRVLRPGGDLLILNFSYRGAEADRCEMPALAATTGFRLRRNGTRELDLWDGLAFWLRRDDDAPPAAAG